MTYMVKFIGDYLNSFKLYQKGKASIKKESPLSENKEN